MEFDLDSEQWIVSEWSRKNYSEYEGKFLECLKFFDSIAEYIDEESIQNLKNKAKSRGWLRFYDEDDYIQVDIYHPRSERIHRYIYIIHQENTDFYKIGYSQNPEQRLRELQTGSPFQLRLIEIYEVTSDNAPYFENKIHGWLSFNRLQGEWFSLSNILLGRLKRRIEYLHKLDWLIDIKPDDFLLDDIVIQQIDDEIEMHE